MKTFKHIATILILTSLLFSACRKDGDQLIPAGETVVQKPVELINATFDGLVVNQSGELLEGVLVEIGDEFVLTNEAGYYRIRTSANLNGARIKVSLDGFHDAYANVIPKEGEVTYTKFKLKTKNLISFPATDSRTVEFGNGHSIFFLGKSFWTEAGENYEGEVYMYADFIDTNSSQSFERFPGDIHGVKQNNLEGLIKNYGIAIIELFDDMGGKLSLTTEAIIRIKPENPMFFTDELNSSWVLDETTAVWHENKSIEVLEDRIRVEQRELGYLCFGFYNDYSTLKLNVKGASKNTRFVYELVNADRSFVKGGEMSNEDEIHIKAPKGEDLFLSINTHCGFTLTDLELLSIGTEDIQEFELDYGELFTENLGVLQAKVFDCQMNPVEEGIAVIKIMDVPAYQVVVPIVNGEFEISFLTCLSNIAVFYEVYVIDYRTNMISDPVVLNGSDFLRKHSLLACDDIADNLMRFTFENGEVHELDYCAFAYTLVWDTINYSVVAVDQQNDNVNYIMNLVINENDIEYTGNFGVVSYQINQDIVYDFEESPDFELDFCVSHDLGNYIFGEIGNVQFWQLDWSEIAPSFSIDKGIGTIHFLSDN